MVAIGGNLPGRYASVREGLRAALLALPGVGFAPVYCSRWWRSAAWPDPADPPFLNAVALVQTALDPAAALAALHALERAFGRDRGRPNAPRPLDLDLIAAGRTVLDGPGLVLPHPRAAERLFVMGPLAEIAPAWRHPVTGETAVTLAARATVGRDAAPLETGPTPH